MRSPSCFFWCVNILLEKRCWRTGISKKQWVFLYNLDYKILLNSNIQNQMHRICFLGVAIKWAAILLLSFPCCCTDQDSDSVTVRWLLHHIFYFCPSFRAGRAHLEQKSQQCVGRWECPTDDKSQMFRFYPGVCVFDMWKICDCPPQLLVYFDSLTLDAMKVNSLL